MHSNFRNSKEGRGGKHTENRGFTFWESFYNAYKAAELKGKGYEYLKTMLAYAFEGKEPYSDDPVMFAFYSAFVPQIDKSMRNIKNGQKKTGG